MLLKQTGWQQYRGGIKNTGFIDETEKRLKDILNNFKTWQVLSDCTNTVFLGQLSSRL